MDTPAHEEILAQTWASPGRRILGIGSLALLGFLLFYLAFTNPPAPLGLVVLLGVGSASLWLSNKMRLSTMNVIELTDTELRDSSGVVIARVEDIESIDRGFFAFKPSNGFLLRTKTRGDRIMRPGLWWRLGRQIGVGGMTPGSQTKFMSEIIAVKIAMRDQPELRPGAEQEPK